MTKIKVKRLVFGVGLNDVDYKTQIKEAILQEDGTKYWKHVWICPFYQTWREMLRRCYSQAYHTKYPTYIGCKVVDEWKSLSNFKKWMITQEWAGNQLDKDLLVKNNKLYSPETCCFISGALNTFLIESSSIRGKYKIGVCWHKATGKFVAQCSDLENASRGHLGLFNTEQDAYLAWLNRKRELAYILAEKQRDPRVAKALINRYENYE